ncbi:carbamoyltransferase [Brevibacillus sp. TJ4]|uniref:carbamoyltransferase family protein n=1 Tax=Brevibacillus sp. TJ4 TaxID=3234853 RepID=UPI0037CD315C
MYILGIGGSEHDFSATLLKNGEIVCSIEDERLTRVKHSLDRDLAITPLAKEWRAVRYCLEEASLSIDDVDLIVGNDLMNPRYIPDTKQEILLINHHLSHAASAFFPSPFEEAAILVVDGIGSRIDSRDRIHETLTLYHGNGNEIKELAKLGGKEIANPVTGWTMYENSVGRFYFRVTSEIGFAFLQEGKTMGLAPYGRDTYVKEFARFYSIDGYRFRQTFEQKLEMVSYIRDVLKREEHSFEAKADLAYAVQHHTETILLSICNELYKATGCKNLCIAGGVALNSVANAKILEDTPFQHVFIQPASGDAGTSIGAALYGYHVLSNRPREATGQLFSPYLGKQYAESEVLAALESCKESIQVEKPADCAETVAQLLTEGYIVAWFHGRSEIGPRALGNRSILVDPRRSEMKDILNARVKHREPFRPFAPIVLEEYQTAYFELDHPSYYMLLVPRVKPDKVEEIPAVTHVDGTGRVQTVSKKLNPYLYGLLEKFYEKTGVPVLLNTSFNDNGEPIVESPADAVKCFLGTDIDYLAINGYLVRKKRP